MTTARKPRSSTAARKTNAAADTITGTNAAAAKTRATPAKPRAKKPAAMPVQVQGTARDAVPAQAAATITQGASAMLQGQASAAALHRMIAEAAYYRAERRGFAPGGELIDWFQAEAEVRGTQRSA